VIRAWLSDWMGGTFALGPAFALVLFLALFAGMLVWIFRPGSTTAYDRDARLPLNANDGGNAPAPDPGRAPRQDAGAGPRTGE
jgi:cbb3-type cytochrome oxidase subunit 3